MRNRSSAGLDVLVVCASWGALAAATSFDWLGRFAPSGQVEVAAVVLYAASVWLAVRNSVLTWPTGIVATALYVVLFYDWGLYADAGLQLVFIAFSIAGLRAWLRRDARPESGQAQRVTARVAVGVLVAVAAGTVVVREYLLAVGGSAPFWDAFLATGSLGALYLLVCKYFETWFMWAVLDVAYIVLFASRELYLSAALYAVLLVMVVRAAYEWRALLHPRRVAEAPA